MHRSVLKKLFPDYSRVQRKFTHELYIGHSQERKHSESAPVAASWQFLAKAAFCASHVFIYGKSLDKNVIALTQAGSIAMSFMTLISPS